MLRIWRFLSKSPRGGAGASTAPFNFRPLHNTTGVARNPQKVITALAMGIGIVVSRLGLRQAKSRPLCVNMGW